MKTCPYENKSPDSISTSFHQVIHPGPAVTQIHLDVSGTCNLNCPLCYNPGGKDIRELSIEEIEHIAKEYQGYAFILGGREPCMRSDLPQIIKTVKKYASAMLLTNGLMLNERSYIDRLMEAGLDGVIFSFNGFKRQSYQELNGCDCLGEKLQALQILKEVSVPTVLSMTVMNSVNTDEIGAVLRWCCENTDFIKELRIRATRPFGRHQKEFDHSLDINGLLKHFSDQSKIDSNKILNGLEFWYSIGKAFLVESYRKRDCTIHFMLLKRNNHWISEGSLIRPGSFKATANYNRYKLFRPVYIILLLRQFITIFGWRVVLRRIRNLGMHFLKFKPASHHSQLAEVKGQKNMLQVTLKSWPGDSFSEQQRSLCQTLYVSRNERRLFCDFQQKDKI